MQAHEPSDAAFAASYSCSHMDTHVLAWFTYVRADLVPHVEAHLRARIAYAHAFFVRAHLYEQANVQARFTHTFAHAYTVACSLVFAWRAHTSSDHVAYTKSDSSTHLGTDV